MRRSLLLLILVPGLTLAMTATVYPVVWTSQMQLKSLADIPQLLAHEKITSVDYVSSDGTPDVTATTCSDYFKLTKQGYSPANNAEIAKESFFKNICDPLSYFQHAQAAKVSYLRNFNLPQDYGLLPAAAIFPSLGDSPDPKGDLTSAFPDIKVKPSKPFVKNSIDVISPTAGMEANISVLGWGDFNHSGVDQMLIFVANYATGGTYHAYTTYILSKKNTNGSITLNKQ